MILNDFEFWVWLAVLSAGSFMILLFIVSFMENIPVIGDYLSDDGHHNNEFLGKIFTPIRFLITVSPVVVPAYLAFSLFTDYRDVKILQNINGNFHQEQAYAYKSTSFFGLTGLALKLGLADEPSGDMGLLSSEQYDEKIKMAYGNDTLFINQSGGPIYASKKYYFSDRYLELAEMDASKYKEGSLDRQIVNAVESKNAHAEKYKKVIKADDFFFDRIEYELFVGCDTPLPDEYSFLTTNSTAFFIGHLTYFTEVPSEQCQSQ